MGVITTRPVDINLEIQVKSMKEVDKTIKKIEDIKKKHPDITDITIRVR